MPRINLLPDAPFEPELQQELVDAGFLLVGADEIPVCPGCLGKGRYVGLIAVEDPCRYCGGTGVASPG